jgi:asparaginyl-tRNA synthetase
MRLNDDEKTVAAMDVLAPGIGEIIGGSQREERLDVLDARIDHGPAGSTTTGGTATCALRHRAARGLRAGLRAAVQYATGMKNIRDVIPFPRRQFSEPALHPVRIPFLKEEDEVVLRNRL